MPDKEENNFKEMIDSYFDEKTLPERKKKRPSRKIKEPDIPEMTEEEILFAEQNAKEEMEQIKNDFLTFVDQISDYTVYGFLYPHIEDFTDTCIDMETLLKQDIIVENLTQKGKEDYQRLLNLRKEILYAVLKKYQD